MTTPAREAPTRDWIWAASDTPDFLIVAPSSGNVIFSEMTPATSWGVASITVMDPIAEMRSTIAQLETRVAILERAVETLQVSIPQQAIILLRTVTKEEAKREIRELFQAGQPLFYSDIATKLRIDLPLVVEICHELMQEEEIEVAADTV